MDPAKQEQMRANRHIIIKWVAESVIFSAQQFIALRGNEESLDSPGNPGNFLSLFQLYTTRLLQNTPGSLKIQELSLPKWPLKYGR